MASTTAHSLREQVAWACRILASEGYVDLTLGHLSARAPGETTVYIKRKGIGLDEVYPEDVVELDLTEERPLAPGMHLEAVLHSEVYKLRDDVGAVVHGHPPYATAFSATDATLALLTHDSVLFADGVVVHGETPELITEPEQARAVAEALGGCRALVLRNHGVLVVGKDVPWAVLAAVTLERAIRLQAIAGALGPLRPIPQAFAERMLDEKYRDGFVEEYWDAWIRRLRRSGADVGMPAA